MADAVSSKQFDLFYVKGRTVHKMAAKKPPVKTNQRLGDISSGAYQYLTLPGGGVVQFDVNALDDADFRAMRSDYQIHLCLSLLTFLILRLDFEVKCADEGSKIAEQSEELLRRRWVRLVRTLCRAFVFGRSPNEVEWEIDPWLKMFVPGAFCDLAPESCQVYVGDTIEEKRANRFKGFKQGTTLIKPDYALWYPLFMESGDWNGNSLLKAAYLPWFMSTVMHLFTNRFYERFGEPTPVGHAPFNQDVEITKDDGTTETVTGREAMEYVLARIKNAAVAVLPSDRDPDGAFEFDIRYLDSQIGHAVEFERYLDRLDMEKARALLTPTLIFDAGQVGSYNAADVHTQTWQTLVYGIAMDMFEYIEKYVLHKIVRFNWGEDAPRTWIEMKPRDRMPDETARAVIQGLISAKLARPDLEALSEYFHMEIEKIEQPPTAPGFPAPKPGEEQQATEKPDNEPTKAVAPEDEIVALAFKPGRTLRPSEEMLNFPQILASFNRNENELRTSIASVVEAMQSRLEGQIIRSANAGTLLKDYPNFTLAQAGAFKAAWKRTMAALYADGYSHVQSENGIAKSGPTRQQMAQATAKAAIVAEKQLGDLTFAAQKAIGDGLKAKRDTAQILAAVAPAFGDFLEPESSLDIAMSLAAGEAMNLGRMDAALASGQAVYGAEWSALLDDRVCRLCEFLDGKIISASSTYFGKLFPGLHPHCRCVLIPLLAPLAADANILRSIPEDLLRYANYGVALFAKEPVCALV